MAASTSKIHERPTSSIASLVRLRGDQVHCVNYVLTRNQSGRRCSRSVNHRASASSIFRVGGWYSTVCRVVKMSAIIGVHHPKIGSTKTERLFEHCIEYRSEITR